MYRPIVFRRTMLELSARRPVRRIPCGITSQESLYLSFRKQYSVGPETNAPQGSKSGSFLPKLVVAGVALGAAGFGAYQLYQTTIEDGESFPAAKVVVDLSNVNKYPREEKNINEKGGESASQVNDKDQPTPEENSEREEDRELLSDSQSNLISQNEAVISNTTPDASLGMKGQEGKNILEQNETSDAMTILAQDKEVEEEKEVKSILIVEQAAKDTPVDKEVEEEKEMKSILIVEQAAKDTPVDAVFVGEGKPNTLLDVYHLPDRDEVPISTQSNQYKDGKLVLDFLQAIHTAEKRQEEMDAHIFAEEKRKMKEKYEKELKDARVRELMYAEDAAILDKELKKERVKAVSSLKSLQETLNNKLRTELEQKEAEAESNLKQVQDLAKAELTSALACEKSSQIEKMSEANLHINALCQAFYARSEEARQSHSIQKLALGTLALEDALSKGLPIQKEIEALHIYLKDMDKEPLLDLALSSLPSETQNYGTDTLLQLRHKFEAMKKTVRHFSFIPPGGGGGIITHSLAHIASWLKVKEVIDESGDGIESVINRVESFLEDGRLPEAADALENCVKGTEAEDVVNDWVKRARNRAITEQALTLLQAYATSVSLT
ncbi:MICOS complex subunit MIC60 isoform X2 [Impatiens glandulifera]|uniref:MICOS complex subunit MIC60 isoform X2 n=1 Tax=Impatiens glandulifera TaxID=253017 RepID=UPI001FB06515|nr:MICOS complex subunit MIC60 isoform X2 [Impatiens glandulifera]